MNTTQKPAALVPPTEVVVARWVWIGASGIATASAVATIALVHVPLVQVRVGVLAAIEVGVALPAALAVTRGKVWARWALLVLGGISTAAAAEALRRGLWPSVVVNVVCAATMWNLRTPKAKAFFRGRRPGRDTAGGR